MVVDRIRIGYVATGFETCHGGLGRPPYVLAGGLGNPPCVRGNGFPAAHFELTYANSHGRTKPLLC